VAVPTITSVTPAFGHTGGQTLVEILGSGFQTWVIPPPSSEPSSDPWPTVEVLFGGSQGTDVAVVTSSRLFVRAPSSPLAGIKPAFGEGAVDLVVRNIDSDGVLIGAETVTQLAGYAYRRAQLATESDMARLVRQLIIELRKQVIPNVSITNHSDFDIDTTDLANIVDVAQLPALVIFGPQLQENRFYSVNGMVNVSRAGFESDRRRAPDTDDLAFTFLGISDLKGEALSLQSLVRQFFKTNRWLQLQRDPNDASLGFVKYDMQLDSGAGGIGYSPPADQKSNLRSFSGSFVVRGFDHEDLVGFAGSDAVGRLHQVTEDPSITSHNKDG
jgi:hypothetical protein